MDYGIRSGGGIGDQIPKISFINSPGYFISGFFYNITFHIIIIWMMTNMFFGIIVDTFADLRENNLKIENDKNDVCFICQLDKDGIVKRKMEYNKHIEDHKIWNYVYFITFLYINNPKDFKTLETYVKKKLDEDDISWFPNESENIENEIK